MILAIYYVKYFCSIKYKKEWPAELSTAWGETGRISDDSGGWRVGLLRGERGKAREAGGSQGPLVEPGDNPLHIDGGCRGHMLQVRFRQAPIPRPAQPKRAHPLREGPFDAGALRILRLALRTGMPGPGGGHGLRLSAWRKPQPAATVFGTSARGADRARRTRLCGKLHNDTATALATSVLPPRR
jgi:hypothetical protein